MAAAAGLPSTAGFSANELDASSNATPSPAPPGPAPPLSVGSIVGIVAALALIAFALAVVIVRRQCTATHALDAAPDEKAEGGP
jgi:phage-related protein